METTSFNVPSITCSVCSNKIQNELKGVDGIEKINVDLKAQTVNVSYNPSEIQPQDIRKKITSIGYEVVQ